MSIIKRNNSNNLFPSFLDDVLGNDILNPSADFNNIGFNVPAANIQEKEDKFVLELAAPGKSKKDFNIELDNDVLTISSVHEDKKKIRMVRTLLVKNTVTSHLLGVLQSLKVLSQIRSRQITKMVS